MTIGLEDQIKMWRDRCGELEIKLQDEQHRRILAERELSEFANRANDMNNISVLELLDFIEQNPYLDSWEVRWKQLRSVLARQQDNLIKSSKTNTCQRCAGTKRASPSLSD